MGQKETNQYLCAICKAGPKVPEVFANGDGLQDCLQSPEAQGKWRESLRAGKVNMHRGALDPEQRWARGEPWVPAAGHPGSGQQLTLHSPIKAL